MFSSVEVDYLKGLLNVYAEQGYKYYIAHTITQSNNNNDFVVYLSKDKITSHSSSSFYLSDNSIVIYVDSSSRNDNGYNSSLHSRDTLDSYSGLVRVDIAEFIYTNAKVEYSSTQDIINPDILLSGVDSYNNNLLNYTVLFFIVSIFLYLVVKTFLRLRC